MPLREEDHVVAVGNAREHAVLTVAHGAAEGLQDVASWSKAAVRKEPLVIHDINGQVLFYDFTLTRGNEPIGYSRVAANELLGTPGVLLEIGPRHWDFERAAAKLLPRARRELGQVGPPRLVCYSYPKLGVMFEVPGKNTRAVYDVASLDPVPFLEGKDIEGAFAWSFLGSLSERERATRLRRYKAFDEARLTVSADLRRQMVSAKSLVATIDQLELTAKMTAVRSRTLQFCNHYASTEARSHHCFSLHAQEVNDYCAVATCQMVLCYYRYYFTQDHIAPELGYSPGGCPSDQSGGYEALTCNHLQASFDSSPTWEKARDEIDALHPFKSGVPRHARACAGYSSARWSLVGSLTDKRLYIYDPWPWNADLKLGGAIYWEDWTSITHTNYVTARINCP